MVRKLPVWKVKDVVEIIDKCQERQFDVIFFIEGKRGLGKSTLAWQLAKKCKSKFNPKTDLCYSRKEVIQQLRKKKRGVIVGDEFINVGFKRDFYVEDQKVLIKGLNMYRDSFNILIGCIPNFQNLDNQLKDLCKLRFTVIRRGIALVHRQVESHFMTDKWDTRNNTKIEMKWSMSKNAKPKYAQLTTAIAYLHFKDISPKQRKLYEEIKHKKRNKIYGKENNLDDDLETKTFYQKLIEEMKAGNVDKEKFKLIVKLQGIKYDSARDYVTMQLKKEKLSFSQLMDKKKEEKEKKPMI